MEPIRKLISLAEFELRLFGGSYEVLEFSPVFDIFLTNSEGDLGRVNPPIEVIVKWEVKALKPEAQSTQRKRPVEKLDASTQLISPKD
jgi:hypothetical protein